MSLKTQSLYNPAQILYSHAFFKEEHNTEFFIKKGGNL